MFFVTMRSLCSPAGAIGLMQILQPALAGYNTRVPGLAAGTGEPVHQR